MINLQKPNEPSQVPQPLQGRGRHFVVTSYDTSQEFIDSVSELYSNGAIKYAILGREVCPSTGRAHLQCYFWTKQQLRISAFRKLIGRHYAEVARGSPAENISYCRKSDPNPLEFGQQPKKPGSSGGAANAERYKSAKNLAIGGRLDDIDADIFIRHYGTLNAIKRDYQTPPSDLPPLSEHQVGYWYYGPAGSGKTYAAIHDFPDAYRKIASNKWWDGYRNEENVIIDDLDKSHDYLGFYLKLWADRYAFNAEMKGKSLFIRPKKLIVTSNWHPKEIWSENQIIEPLLRRFKIVRFSDFFSNHHRDDDEVRPAYSDLLNTNV